MNTTDKNLDGRWYFDGQLDFDRKLIYYRYKTLKPYIKGPIGLELGSAEGEMTQYLIEDFEYLTSVDGSKELLEMIPSYKNHTKIHSFFEDYKPNQKFNTIIMEHILEHVDNPIDIMIRAKEWLSDNGVMILGVPNALSIHRLVAVKMGLLKAPNELNERDYQLGHQRVYSMETFIKDIKEAGLTIIEKGGVFFKPLSNGQIETNWNDNMIEGFYELGKDFQKMLQKFLLYVKNKMFDYIFLDLDGPILEGKFRHYACYKDIIKKYGGNALEIDYYWELKRNKITRDIILEKSNFQESYEIFFKEWMKNIEDEKYLNLDSLKPEVVETLKSWRNITDKIVLVTMRQSRKYLLNQLDNLGVLSFLDEVIDCPPQRKNTKYEALKNKNFQTAIFIGDTEEDTNTAKMLGIKSIGIINGLRKKELLEADYYFEEIKDIDLRLIQG